MTSIHEKIAAGPQVEDPTKPSRAAWSPATWRICIAVAAVGIIAAYFLNLIELVQSWREHADYSHGFFVMPVAFAIFWRLRRDSNATIQPAGSGWVLLMIILAARSIAHERGEFWAETATFPIAVAAMVVAFGGWRLFGSTCPAIAYLIFMLPVPASFDMTISVPLQRLAAAASGEVLRMTGFWVLNEGNTLVFDAERLEVADACNGLAMLMSLSATVVAMILLVRMTPGKRAMLLLAVVPIAISCNILRIVSTAWCYKYLASATTRAVVHDTAGWLMMPLALLLVWLELKWLGLVFAEPIDDEVGEDVDHTRCVRPATIPA